MVGDADSVFDPLFCLLVDFGKYSLVPDRSQEAYNPQESYAERTGLLFSFALSSSRIFSNFSCFFEYNFLSDFLAQTL